MSRPAGWTSWRKRRWQDESRGEQTKELAAKLAEEGTPVAYLEGGVLAWEAEGFPVDRPD